MSPANLPVFEQCLVQALDLCRVWVPDWLDRVFTRLREREAMERQWHERQALLEACLALNRQRDAVASQWLQALAQRLEEAPGAQAGASRRAPLSFDDLELMGDEQVLERVEVARVQQALALGVDEAFNDFTARLSSAQGFRVVTAEANPLGVATFVETLLQALRELQIAPGARTRWLQVGAPPLGEALTRFYARLSQRLAEQGIAPAGYAVAAREPAPRREVGEPLDIPVDDPGPLLTLDHLHRLLVGQLDAPGGEALSQAIAVEVANQMLQRIAADERLLAPVRAALQTLQPALQAIAREQPRFFADRHNPARRLLDAVTARALAFVSEHDAGLDSFLADLRDVVSALKEPGVAQEERWARLLARLQRAQTQAVAQDEWRARQRAMQTLARVEQRHLLAEKVAAEFRVRADFAKAPGPVQRFLATAWAQVVAQARIDEALRPPLISGETDAQRFTDILGDLLWSSQLALASLNRPRLVKVIAPVLRTLREGLDTIDYPREKSEPFFQTLMGLHEAAYRTQRIEPVGEAGAPIAAVVPVAPPDAQASRLDAQDTDPWIGHEEARETHFYEDTPATAAAPVIPPPQRDATQLVVGSWFDLWQDEKALRVQLTWASPHATLYLFGSASGRSLSMTRRGIDRLLEQDRLRVVADHSVVDEALNAVAQQALRNSGRT